MIQNKKQSILFGLVQILQTKEEMNCQDCGNQAKKDCAHLRCRTCCKKIEGLSAKLTLKVLDFLLPKGKRGNTNSQLCKHSHDHSFRLTWTPTAAPSSLMHFGAKVCTAICQHGGPTWLTFFSYRQPHMTHDPCYLFLANQHWHSRCEARSLLARS